MMFLLYKNNEVTLAPSVYAPRLQLKALMKAGGRVSLFMDGHYFAVLI